MIDFFLFFFSKLYYIFQVGSDEFIAEQLFSDNKRFVLNFVNFPEF